MQNFFNNTKKINNIKGKGKILFILFLVFCCFVFKAQSEVSTEKANTVEAQFEAGKFQMESMENPQFMNGKCYYFEPEKMLAQRADGRIVEISTGNPFAVKYNTVEVLLYPHKGQILFYGAFGSRHEPAVYTSLEEPVEKFFGREDIETKLDNDLDSNRKIESVEGGVAFWDMSSEVSSTGYGNALGMLKSQFQRQQQPLFMTKETGPPEPEQLKKHTVEYSITQSLDDPNKAFLKRISGTETSYCELEIMK